MAKRRHLPLLTHRLRAFLKWLFSPRVVPTLKGLLAYELLLILSFLSAYAKINPFPPSLASAVILTIASTPGSTLGACILNTGLNLLGVMVGSFNFWILAMLAGWPVAQGVVFALMVYLLALVYAQGLTFLGFSLLGILQSFTGIFTSLASPSPSPSPGFNPAQLRGYLQSYALSALCVLLINVLFLPRTAERELRKRVAESLGRVRALWVFVMGGYGRVLREGERGGMDRVVGLLRQDHLLLTTLLSQTSLEPTFSPHSLPQLRSIVSKTQEIIRLMIAAYYGLMTGEEDGSVGTFREVVLPAGEGKAEGEGEGEVKGRWAGLGREVWCFLGEMICQIGGEEGVDAGREGREVDGGDVEKQDASHPSLGGEEGGEGGEDETLEQMARRLLRELESFSPRRAPPSENGSKPAETRGEANDLRPVPPSSQGQTIVDQQLSGPRRPSPSSAPSSSHSQPSSSTTPTNPSPTPPQAPTHPSSNRLKKSFDALALPLLALQSSLLLSGGLSVDITHDRLRLFRPGRSGAEAWGRDRVRGVQEALDRDREKGGGGERGYGVYAQTLGAGVMDGEGMKERRNGSAPAGEGIQGGRGHGGEEKGEPGPRIVEAAEDPDALRTGHALVRVYSVLYALNRLIGKLQSLHSELVPPPSSPPPRTRLQLHPLSALQHLYATYRSRTACEQLSLQQAICELERRPYFPERVTVMQRLLGVERWFRAGESVYAFKIVLALCIFSVLIWAPLVRGWFISYALITALPNLVLALAPTLGATWLSFAIQILGTVIGNIWAMIVLLIFHNVGGYFYNPYGIACLLAIYAFPLAYCVHEKPQLFLFGLLAMNSCGATIVMVYVQTVDEQVPNYNTPAFSAAIGLAALAVALGIVFCFQLLILRNPARHALRLAVAGLIEDHLSYVTMLQAYVRALELVDPNDRPSPDVVRRVEHELKRRERDLQERIIAMDQLVTFAALEPNWQRPFRRDAALKVLRANQLLIDRWSETLAALGSEPFPLWVSQQFISVLSPYRRQCFTTTKTSLYLAATSMASKIPLPIESPNPGRLTSDLVHDALLLSSRYAKTEEGKETVKSSDFARYWFFLLANMSANQHVADIENAIREIYGTFEDKVR